MSDKQILLDSVLKIHTTPLGEIRAAKNIGCSDVTAQCRAALNDSDSAVERRGKNYYVTYGGNVFTVNAYSFTIITAHRE